MGLAAPAGRGRPGRQRLHAGCATSSRRVGWGVRGHVAQWRPQTRGLLGCGGIELRPFPTHTCFRRPGLPPVPPSVRPSSVVLPVPATVSSFPRRGLLRTCAATRAEPSRPLRGDPRTSCTSFPPCPCPSSSSCCPSCFFLSLLFSFPSYASRPWPSARRCPTLASPHRAERPHSTPSVGSASG